MTKPTKEVIEYAKENGWQWQEKPYGCFVKGLASFVPAGSELFPVNEMSSGTMQQLYQNRQAYAEKIIRKIKKGINEQIKAFKENLEYHQNNTKNERLIKDFESAIMAEEWCLEEVDRQRKLNNQKKEKL